MLRSAAQRSEEAAGPAHKAACLIRGNTVCTRAKGSALVVAFAGGFTFDTSVYCFSLIVIP